MIDLIVSHSGILHLARCNVTHGFRFTLFPGEELIGFTLAWRRFCSRCIGRPR